MSKRMIILVLVLIAAGCAPVATKPSGETITIDEALLGQSDYVDVVYEDGAFSYLSYLKAADLLEEDEKSPCTYTPQKPASHTNGIWIWDIRRVAGREKEVIERLLRDRIGKIYIQIGEDLDLFRPLLKEAKEKGITVFALDGSPDYIDDYSILLNDVKRVQEFNRRNGDIAFEGLQVDVEPYLKKDFNIRKKHYVRQYREMALDLRKAAGKDLRISFALPFWFDKLVIDGKPLSFAVIDIADEVAIMSYRTDYDEIIESAYDELCYGSTVNKPVFLGLELTRLPDERHVVVAKKEILRYSDVLNQKRSLPKTLPEDLPVFRRYEVKSDKITFFSKRERLKPILDRVPPFKSFSGYIIHSYEGLYE